MSFFKTQTKFIFKLRILSKNCLTFSHETKKKRMHFVFISSVFSKKMAKKKMLSREFKKKGIK